jgi:tetratricopeptide (TPR) repeat protein
MPSHSPLHLAVRATAAAVSMLVLMQGAGAQTAAPAPVVESATAVENSDLDRDLFYQLLRGELELRTGDLGSAYEHLLDAARRTKDEALFRRAVEVALQNRSADQALGAIQAWRAAVPDSLDALRYQIQLLLRMNRMADTVEPIRTMLQVAPPAERPGMIGSLPHLFGRSGGDRQQSAKLLEQVLQPSLKAADTKQAATVAIGQAWLFAGDAPRALALAQQAHALDPTADTPALLALELMATMPAAEAIVTSHLQAKPVSTPIRLVYARVLSTAQRYGEAIPQLEAVTKAAPQLSPPWLTLGALHLELNHPREATEVLTQYVKQMTANEASPAGAQADDEDDESDVDVSSGDQGLTQAYLMLATAAERQGDFKAAEGWLEKVTSPQRALDVQMRRASILARQGKVQQARELIRAVPERTAEDARAKLLAEAQVLRDVKNWTEANAVLVTANQRFPNDADLLYEQSMMAEKLNRMDEMERLLRKVIELKPDHHHAYNALGYSLAERNLRLSEARGLIQKALDLAPGEPFITDSLGWVEYRLGNRDEALRLLRIAYKARPDVEIGAHLGEVLWVNGQRDEARTVWRAAREKDGGNEVLRETLARLKADL